MKTDMLVRYRHNIILLLVLLMYKHEAKGQRVLLSGVGPLTIKKEKFVLQCQPDNAGEGFETLTSIEISRRIQGEINFKPAVRATPSNAIQWLDESIRQRISIDNARVGTPSSSFIRYEIEGERTDCTDASQYKCYITTKTFNLSQTVTVFPEVNAESDLTLIASPSNAGGQLDLTIPNNAFATLNGTYTLGTSVWLACTVAAGEPPAAITWCVRKAGSSSFSRDGLVPYVQDEYGETPQTACFIQRTSVITYIVNTDDIQTDIVCETQRQDSNRFRDCGNGVANAVFTVSVYQPPVITTATTTTVQPIAVSTDSSVIIDDSGFLASQGDDELHSVGLAFMVVGALLLIVVSVILAFSLVFYFKSKKIKKEAEMQMIRSTYDSLAVTKKADDNNTSTYAALRTGRGQQDVNRPDSDGYATPSMLYHDIENTVHNTK